MSVIRMLKSTEITLSKNPEAFFGFCYQIVSSSISVIAKGLQVNLYSNDMGGES